MTLDPALSVRGVSVDLGGRRVLHEVSLELVPGEILGIVGPNGSGKTTLLRTILGLQDPVQGDVRLLGRPLRSLTPTARARRAAWLPQEEKPSENLAVEDYVGLSRYPHIGAFGLEEKVDREAVDGAIRDCSLEPFRYRGVQDLSGGERQRVMFARALAQGAPLLILDEPTSHLDLARQLELMEYLDRFRSSGEGRAVMLSVHDLNLACRFADRLLWLSEGRVRASGSPTDTVTEERIFQVFGVSTEVHRRGGLIAVFPRRPQSVPGSPNALGRRVHVVCGGGSGREILHRLVEAGYEVTAGVLNLLDSDQETCEELHIPAVLEAPFSMLSEEVRRKNRGEMAHAPVLILAPLVVGHGNLGNVEDLLQMAPGRKVYLVGGPPREGRDFIGGRATQVYDALVHAGGMEVAGPEDLLHMLSAEPKVTTPAGSAKEAQG